MARLRSHYGHLVRTGRAVLPLDEALAGPRGTLVKRSVYAPGIARYQALFERVHVMLFEEFVADPQAAMRGLTDFLELAPIDVDALDAAVLHRHPGSSPRSLGLQLAANWQRRPTSLCAMGWDPASTRRRAHALPAPLFTKRYPQIDATSRSPAKNLHNRFIPTGCRQ